MIMSEYKDTIIELDILQDLRADLVRQLEQQHRIVWTGMAPSAPMPAHVPLDKALSKYDNVVERLRAIESEIGMKRKLIQGIDEKLSKLNGLNHTIGYKRLVEGKSLKEIADEIGYSYSHVRNVMSGAKVQS
ncbi:hypothetical protein [Cohnella sp.]|uniref:hypothetical protein n=1 Tax=Cohnella sp. TaxID=1883426 RepID=UPI00356A4B64